MRSLRQNRECPDSGPQSILETGRNVDSICFCRNESRANRFDVQRFENGPVDRLAIVLRQNENRNCVRYAEECDRIFQLSILDEKHAVAFQEADKKQKIKETSQM